MANFRIIVSTQNHENYAAHTDYVPGVTRDHWKAKGGSDYVVGHVTTQQLLDITNSGQTVESYVEAMIDENRSQIEQDDDYYRSYILGWDLVEGLTDYEQQDLEMDGVIMYPAHDLTADNHRVCPATGFDPKDYINKFWDNMDTA